MLFTTFLPITIRAIGPKFVKKVITKICYFFNRVTQKVVDPDELANLQ